MRHAIVEYLLRVDKLPVVFLSHCCFGCSPVIICLLDLMAARELLLAAHALGYTSGDYVFILPGLTEMPTMDLWKRNNTEEDKVNLLRNIFLII